MRVLLLVLALAVRDTGCQIISPSQVIQAHTILKEVAPKYENSAVLVLGGQRNDVRNVALGYINFSFLHHLCRSRTVKCTSYGFTQVYTPIDVLAWNPS